MMIGAASTGAARQTGSAAQNADQPYTLRVQANEISVTFHAVDENGHPLTNLTQKDIELRDDGRVQKHITMLQSFQDLPIRGGFLFDASPSMYYYLDANRAVMQLYSSRLLRPSVDRAFVAQFDQEVLPLADWTDSDAALIAGANRIGRESNRIATTAIFDTLYRECRDRWTQFRGETTGNFLVLFSDGEDNASHVYLSEAVDMCQRSRTAIYAISNSRHTAFISEGQQTLERLAAQTGGRVFYRLWGEEAWKAMQEIESEQRNQYRLTYLPANFKADGKFHAIRLRCPERETKFVVRSGYYAVARP
jgi:Ca-activated chloride channel homolog